MAADDVWPCAGSPQTYPWQSSHHPPLKSPGAGIPGPAGLYIGFTMVPGSFLQCCGLAGCTLLCNPLCLLFMAATACALLQQVFPFSQPALLRHNQWCWWAAPLELAVL